MWAGGDGLSAVVSACGGDHATAKGGLARIARRREVSPAQVAIAWLLARSPVVVPIPGTSAIAHLEQNVAAARMELSAEDLQDLA